VLTLWHWHGQPAGLTRQGLAGAGLVVARVAASISLVGALPVSVLLVWGERVLRG
jgi:hypothetical protein